MALTAMALSSFLHRWRAELWPSRSRSYSTQAICDDAKAKLRLFYLLIHPDLFYGDSERARVNEKSFKLLQDFVSNASLAGLANSHQTSAPNYHAAYQLEFYVNRDQNPKISVTLPAPSSASPMAIRRNLNKLFRAADIDELVCYDEDRDTHTSMPLSLQEFIPLVHEQYLHDLTDTSTPDVSLRTMLAALHYSRRLRIVFSKDAERSSHSALWKLTILRDFAGKCLEECSPELDGLTVGFGRNFSQDVSQGAIWLDSTASPETWVRFLKNVNLRQLHEGLEMRAAVRQLAYEAAGVLGVASIQYADETNDTENYLYESMLLSILRWTPPESATFEGIDLIVVSGELAPDGTEKDIDCGILHVSVSDSPTRIYEILKQYGPKAQEHVRRRRHAAAKAKALVSQVERTLRLRLLSKHPDLEEYRYKAACQRLLANANELHVLEGLKLRVGEKNAYVKGRGLVEIAWDFRL